MQFWAQIRKPSAVCTRSFLDKVIGMPRCCARCHFHGSMVVDIFVVAQRQLPWSAYSADHKDCPVAAHRQGVRRSGGPAGSSGAGVEKTVEIPQLQLVHVLGCRRGEDGRDPTVAAR